MGIGGTYRINDVEFPAPESSEWEANVIGAGLNGIPRLNSYYRHRWSWSALDGSYMEQLMTLFLAQLSGGAQLSYLETDPYDASGACQRYGTESYTNFIILSVTPLTRGLPLYSNPTVEFEVYVS